MKCFTQNEEALLIFACCKSVAGKPGEGKKQDKVDRSQTRLLKSYATVPENSRPGKYGRRAELMGQRGFQIVHRRAAIE